MQPRFCTILIALGASLLARETLAQAAPPAQPAPAPQRPAPPRAAPAPAAPAPAAPAPAPAAPAPAAPAEPPPDADAALDDAETEPPPAEPAEPAPQLPPAGAAPGQPPLSPLPTLPEPTSDAAALERMGRERPATTQAPDDETSVFAEDWWSHARPILELHGYFRVRAEMFYRFSLNRVEVPTAAIWPRPPDAPYTSSRGRLHGANLCTADEAGTGSNDDPSNLQRCKNNTQAGANLRFRLNPEIHVSDNLRVVSQIDLLDNLVLGSTPSHYSVSPSENGGYAVNARSPYAELGFQEDTTSPPRSGVNSIRDSIQIKRVWGEYATPVGELRFGRMPNHWGLGIVNHSGDGHDDDYQSTIDRLQFVAGIKPLELFFSAAWDFPNEGATSDSISLPLAQPYDLAQADDVSQYVFSVARKKSPELQRLALSRGNLVVNGGLQLTYRSQHLASDDAGACALDAGTATASLGCEPGEVGFTRRDAHYWLPDLWLQLLYKQFRFEVEAATVQGSIGDAGVSQNSNESFDLSQWGLAAEIEQRLVEDRLKLGFSFGWASGDADVNGLAPIASDNVQGQIGDSSIETFRFNPSYRVDMILYRNILTRVQGTYYFRPNLSYDFLREPTGQRLGGSIAAVWSRASEFVQAPGHERDLGVEFNAGVHFQSKDGAANDDPQQMGGFYSRLEYGVLFPMAGLGYPDAESDDIAAARGSRPDVSSAQILRLYLGILF